MVHRNLSMTPEIPRKDLSIIKSLNSTSCEEHCNWEEMVGEAKYSCGNIHSECSTVSHVPGTEGEASSDLRSERAEICVKISLTSFCILTWCLGIWNHSQKLLDSSVHWPLYNNMLARPYVLTIVTRVIFENSTCLQNMSKSNRSMIPYNALKTRRGLRILC